MAFRNGGGGRRGIQVSPLTSPRGSRISSNSNARPVNNAEDRPIRSGGNFTFPSGRSSYNLNFVDWENEWERLEDEDFSDDSNALAFDDLEESTSQVRRQWETDYQEYLTQLQNNNTGNALVTNTNDDSSGQSESNPLSSMAQQLTTTALHSGFDCLNPMVASTLIAVTFRKGRQGSGSNGEVCGICLENFGNGSRIYDLVCNHKFHVSCLNPWLPRSKLCPMCRQEILPKPQQNPNVRGSSFGADHKDMKKRPPK